MSLRTVFRSALALGVAVALLPAVSPAQSSAERVAQASRDWNAGRYDVALATLADVLKAPNTDSLLPSIAQLTGEPYRTIEVAKDLGTTTWRPRWAPDSRHLVFETVLPENGGVRSQIAIVEDSLRRLVAVTGRGLVFARDSRSVAYLALAADAPARVVWRSLNNGQERNLNTGTLTFSELAFGADGALFGVGRATDGASQIYTWPAGSTEAPRVVTTSDSAKAELVVVGSRHLVYGIRAPAGGAGAAGGGGGGGGRGGGGGGAGASFEVFDLTTNTARRFAGRNVVVARDGGALVFLTGGGGGGGGRGGGRGAGAPADPTNVMRLSLAPLGAPQIVFSTRNPIAAPAISPDGARIAFQQTLREDSELFAMAATDSQPTRITHEIQHDLSPQFLTNGTLLGLIGEGRHRRSHTYDLATRTRTKLFHNNTVRTVAPEYEWVVSPDGSKVLIGAERDGDTVTPHRWLYCTDVTRPVSRAILTARVDSALTAERALRAYATRAYQPIETAVRQAVNDVDVGRIFAHAKTLFSFDSKHITQPGNAKAIEYLHAAYKSFGYDAKLQQFDTPAGGGRGGAGGTISTANVLAILPGTVNPELVYVVGSHFDSVQPGAGADDNTSGTTALLEAARVLAKRPQPATIIFVSFTGEEAGLRGSREFVRVAQRDSMKLVGALNNDMVGFANDERMDNTIRYSNPGIRDIQHAAAIKFTNLITYDAFYYKSTDAAAFYDAYGDIVGGIGSYPILGNPHYHQSHDVLETINQQLVAEVSKTTVATLMLLASSPSRLRNVKAERTGSAVDVTWTPSPEKNIVGYDIHYGRPNAAGFRTMRVTQPRVRLADVPPGTHIMVKAVNARGLEGWDWARITAP